MKKKSRFMVLAVIALAGCIAILIYTVSRYHSRQPAPPKELIMIGDQTFVCCFYDENEHGWIKGYVLQDQTIENWEKMVGVRYFNHLASPEKYIQTLADLYASDYPHMQFATFQKEETGQWVIDYIVYTKGQKGFVKWDYFQAEHAKDGPGIIVNQYTIRAPFSGSMKPAYDQLNLAERRPELLKTLMKSDFKSEPIK
jgi:hypothetical protein